MARFVLKGLLGLSILGTAVANIPPSESPTASVDLICHTENPADCYPRIFQPTEDFQIIHDDQDIPPGLHVRMDIYSGTKEARLNVPMEGETDMEDLPTEQTVLVIPQPEKEDSVVDDTPALRDRVPQKPPVYEAAGKIKPPREPDDNDGEPQDFSRAISNLDGNHIHDPMYDERVNTALTALQDLSHDIYYGVEIAKRSDVLQQLLLYMIPDKEKDSNIETRRHQAASVLGHSVQNNPTALKEVRESWKRLMHPVCNDKTKNSLGKSVCETQDVMGKIQQSIQLETDPIVSKAKIYALSGLVKDRALRDEFLRNNGMQQLSSLFLKEGEQWEPTRIRIAQFVMDNFLDENMGAEMGVWPQEPELAPHLCEDATYATRDGCWQHNLLKMGAGHPKHEGSWKSELLRLLDSARVGKGPDRNEL